VARPWRRWPCSGYFGRERERPMGASGWPGHGSSISATNLRKEGPGGLAYHEGQPWRRRWLLCVDGEPLQSTRAPPEGWGRFPGAEAEVEAKAIGSWMGAHGGFCRWSRRLLATPASVPMRRLFSPRWLFCCSVRWLQSSLSRLLAVQPHPPPTSPGLQRPRPGTGWRRAGGGVAGGRGQRPCSAGASRAAGSLRRMPSWRAESARDASCRSCPIQRLCFYYRRGPVSC